MSGISSSSSASSFEASPVAVAASVELPPSVGVPGAAAASPTGASAAGSSSNMFLFMANMRVLAVAVNLFPRRALRGAVASTCAFLFKSEPDVNAQNNSPCEKAAYKQTIPAMRYRQLKACSSPFFSRKAWRPGDELARSCTYVPDVKNTIAQAAAHAAAVAAGGCKNGNGHYLKCLRARHHPCCSREWETEAWKGAGTKHTQRTHTHQQTHHTKHTQTNTKMSAHTQKKKFISGTFILVFTLVSQLK